MSNPRRRQITVWSLYSRSLSRKVGGQKSLEVRDTLSLARKAPGERRPNLNPAFVADMGKRLGLNFVPDGRGDRKKTFGPEDVFHYIYAVFHSPTYRKRYAEFLKIDFPSRAAHLGRELVRRSLCQSRRGAWSLCICSNLLKLAELYRAVIRSEGSEHWSRRVIPKYRCARRAGAGRRGRSRFEAGPGVYQQGRPAKT